MTTHDVTSIPSVQDETLVCYCHAVTRGELVEAIRKGARTLGQLQSETLASTGCSGCECEVAGLLERVLRAEIPAP